MWQALKILIVISLTSCASEDSQIKKSIIEKSKRERAEEELAENTKNNFGNIQGEESGNAKSEHNPTIHQDFLDHPDYEKYQLGSTALTFSEYADEQPYADLVIHDKEEKDYLPNDHSVRREDDTLFFKLSNGKEVKLVDDMSDNIDMIHEESVRYFFKGSLDSNYWEIYAVCYECYFTVLINKHTRGRINTIGQPYLSKNKKYLIVINEDLHAGFTQNGFELFEYVNNRLQLIGSRELDEWGPVEVKWISDNKFWIKQKWLTNYTESIKFAKGKIDEKH